MLYPSSIISVFPSFCPSLSLFPFSLARLASHWRHRHFRLQRGTQSRRPEEEHLQAVSRRVHRAGEDRERVLAVFLRGADFRPRRIAQILPRRRHRPGKVRR